MLNEKSSWLEYMSEEDIQFIKNFMLFSGSMKKISKLYDVSYPTIRLRLDRLIQKIELYNERKTKPFNKYIMQLVIDENIDLDVAKKIIIKYEKEKEG